MKTKENEPFAHTMAFFHEDGLPPAWKQATRFAGKEGRLAVMPDIVSARLASRPGEAPWETYYTTLTAEYFGISKKGNYILIIAHGVGPMSTLEGIQKAYSWEYQDKTRSKRGGRITQEQFWDLEAGKFGDVEIIDLDAYYHLYKYAFRQVLRFSEAVRDPVLKARLGEDSYNYLLAHAEHARAWHREQANLEPSEWEELLSLQHWDDQYWNNWYGERVALHAKNALPGSDPYIIEVGDANNCSYGWRDGQNIKYRPIEEGYALAHLISTGRLVNMHHEGNESLILDIDCHEWWNGVRLVGIKSGGSLQSGINPGPNAYKLIQKYWRDLLVPVEKPEPVGFCGLVQMDEQWFTQYPKKGARMDTGEPEYLITEIEKVGEPVIFRTTVGNYHGFFKFDVGEVQAIASPKVNAYFFVGKPECEWNNGSPTHHICSVQFYYIEIDASKRIIRKGQLCYDYDTMMKLMTKEMSA